jgi:dihydrofolate synthase/folylpolyglutamate synthase
VNYQQALHYLLEQLPMFQRVGAAAYRADLTNITELCSILKNPQQYLKCIHIAGTNGKGSVSHITASILQEQGYKVGVFVSPHYKDYRERIKINGKLISKNFVTNFVAKNLPKFKKVNASFFEISTAMAFQYFYEKKVDYVILETGMGGRLDSTNIIQPILSVITNISLDHQQFLGYTLTKIATEKAGIIKRETPVVIGETQKETKTVFLQKAKYENAPIVFADKEVILTDFKSNPLATTFSINNKKYQTDISGNYQKKNITTAFCAIEQLKKQGIIIHQKAITNGIKQVSKNTYFIGRWMVQQEKPLVIFDSAHNEGGIKELIAQIKTLSFQQLHFVYGTVADKDLSKIFALLPKKAMYYFCKPNIARGKNAVLLQQDALKHNLKGEYYNTVKDAYCTALGNAKKKDLILVSGSIFIVAEVI